MSRRRSPRASDLAFPTLSRERQQARALFSIDIERSFRDWMEQLAPDFEAHIHGQPTHPAFSRQLDLTPRQRECLSLLACGYSREEAGQVLSLSMETVKSHMRGVTRKLGSANHVQAIFIAALVGELDPEILREHLFRQWELPGLAAPGRPVAA